MKLNFVPTQCLPPLFGLKIDIISKNNRALPANVLFSFSGVVVSNKLPESKDNQVTKEGRQGHIGLSCNINRSISNCLEESTACVNIIMICCYDYIINQ